MDSATQTSLWPFAVYFAATIALAGGIILVSHFLGPRRLRKENRIPYESGIVSTGSARIRISVRYYLISMFFVIFDLEAVFIIAWAIAFRQAGWTGFVAISIFIGALLAALVYLWRVGSLDLVSRRRIPGV